MGLESKKCLNCGKEFLSGVNNRKYCSPACYQLNLRKEMNKVRKKEAEKILRGDT